MKSQSKEVHQFLGADASSFSQAYDDLQLRGSPRTPKLP